MAGPMSTDGSDMFETPSSSMPTTSAMRTPLPRAGQPTFADVPTPQHHNQAGLLILSPLVAADAPGVANIPTATQYRPAVHSFDIIQYRPKEEKHPGTFSAEEDDDGDDEDDEAGPSRGRRAREPVPPELPLDDDMSDLDDPVTVKERQSLINVEHPFGLRIWKPALYKKSRTVNRVAEFDLHSAPSAIVERHLIPGNIVWTLVFGWWLALIFTILSGPLWLLPRGGRQYGSLVFGLGWYVFWPFGKYVEGDLDEEERKQFEKELNEAEGVQPARDHDRHSSAGDTVRAPSVSGSPVAQRAELSDSTRQHDQTDSWNPPTERTSLIANTNSDLSATPTRPNPPLPAKSYGALRQPSPDPNQDPSATPLPGGPTPAEVKRHWLGQYMYWFAFGVIIAPLLGLVTLACYGLVFTIPMAKLNGALLKHLWLHPLKIRFCAAPPGVVVPTPPASSEAEDQTESDENANSNANGASYIVRKTRLHPGQAVLTSGRARQYGVRSTVLMCTYRAFGSKYYKYTIGGINIMFINLIPIVFFAIFDALVLEKVADRRREHGKHVPWLLDVLTQRVVIFTLSLASVVPLSYYIGMAVASISAQSSIGMGAVINATFGSIIEIILYGIALTDSKGRLVEGSIVGSLLAGVLLMPGASMCSGALRQKEQRFNARSAGVTSTMLIMAIIGVVCPTLFYQTYGNFQLVCDGCPTSMPGDDTPPNAPWMCTHCRYEHPDPIYDPFYQSTVKSLMYFCAGVLLLSYLIGLWFSLRTHATSIWQNPQQLMQPTEQMVTSGSLRISGAGKGTLLPTHQKTLNRKASAATLTGILSGSGGNTGPSGSPTNTRRISYAPPPALQFQTGQTLAPPQQGPQHPQTGTMTPVFESVQQAVKNNQSLQPTNFSTDDFTRAVAVATVSALRHQQGQRRAVISEHDGADGGHGGHDAPSWSRGLSASVLLACTALYAIIAEILVDEVDVLLEGTGIDEKFLGITLFALVPNTTEFMNAMSFAMTGNIALSMEIGSAYALQVCLLQIPAMVAFSAWWDPQKMGTNADTFTLIFPRWDVIAIIFSIFLLTYTYIEAKSNYHRGSILILSYLVLISGFYWAPSPTESGENDDFAGMFKQAVASSALSWKQYLQVWFQALWAR
ncbi:Sodium/calcium exchanger protein [Ceratobasidium sp. AG-Ba]|nr:Sodium/calcium exchanger protein [Ceratobasidium sp. AG-Ba]